MPLTVMAVAAATPLAIGFEGYRGYALRPSTSSGSSRAKPTLGSKRESRDDRGDHLTKNIGATLAVDHVNLTIKPGEVFCLLGANGAGKTTTINLFLNFVEPTSGAARIDGLTSSSIRSKRRSVSPTFPSRSCSTAT